MLPLHNAGGQAFAKRLAFDALSEFTGIECRAVQFDVPRQDLECFNQIKGFESSNFVTETFTMLQPFYGLKDVPRARRKKLHQVLSGLAPMPASVRGAGILLRA